MSNPDDRLLPPPPGNPQVAKTATSSRKIINPDDKLLVPPSPEELKAYETEGKHQDLRIVGKAYGERVIVGAEGSKKTERLDWLHLGVVFTIALLVVKSLKQ